MKKKNLQYLVSPALCLTVTVIKFLQRHFGVDKAYVGLELVFDGFNVLRGKEQECTHIWSVLACFQLEINTITNTTNTNTTVLSEHQLAGAKNI